MTRKTAARLGPLLLACCLLGCAPAPEHHPDETAVRAFLTRYFSTWSAQDMAGYGDCFHESARITYLPLSGPPRTDSLTDFLYGQRMGHKTSPDPMTEVADAMHIQMDDRAAIARVSWTLTKAQQKTTGIDHFSLIKTPAGWKIIHLLFYAD
jgi:hypothetical protein